MTEERTEAGPVKAWIEPDRWAFVRAHPVEATMSFAGLTLSVLLALSLHPAFWIVATFAMFRQANAESLLRELWREGMLHPAEVLRDMPGKLATLVRLEGHNGVQDAVVISRVPRRWKGPLPPWGGERSAVVITGEPPKLRPLSVDFATGDLARAKRATERIPEAQWQALKSAIAQLKGPIEEGVHPVQLGDAPWYGTLSHLEAGGSLPEHLSETQPTAFCAGLPCVEEPTFQPRERERVRKLRLMALRKTGLYLLFAIVPPFALGFMSQLPLFLVEGAVKSVIITLGGLSLIALPLWLILAWSALRKARAYSRDLAEGRLMRFLGSISSFDSLSLDPDLALLTRRGVIQPEPGEEQDLVVLPHASEPLHANGRWVPPGIVVRVERVAVPPEQPFKMPLPQDVHADVNDAVAVARRRLTELEVAELSRHARALKQPGQVFWLLTAIAAFALSSWHEQDWVFPPKPISLVLAVVAWGFAGIASLKRVRLANLLAQDAALGWVVTVDSRALHRDQDQSELPARGVETLLHSRMDWTVNRRPAAWRRFASRG